MKCEKQNKVLFEIVSLPLSCFMQKNNFISIALLFAFTLAILHNVIPHQHYDDISEVVHHHHDGEHHHHDNESNQDDNESNQDDNDEEPVSFFSHLCHLATTDKLSFVLNSNSELKKNNSNDNYFTKIDFQFKEFQVRTAKEIPKSVASTNYHFRQTQSLRGPPSFFL